MYLKKLELVGFKSFLNKTTLHFEPGVTAVVGPNGCGKSNIFDSIRWVLGEQSVKSLRGSDMQDVIFNGTDVKEPLSMAEVTLSFDNSNKFFNFDHDEVAITRRIFRSGESEYLLNKSLVRLKDILDLLMGTGIGAESYSLVAQGKIDLILSSRPEDRRLVFDEASGITKYKSRKIEAARKLEETEANLLRVNDIISEVKRQISSLERQANKARRYKEIFEELKSKEINLALVQKRGLISQKDNLIKQLSELESQEVALMEQVADQESKMSNRQQELKTLEDSIMAIKHEILNLDNLVIRNKERISFNQERITELETSAKYIQTQIEQAKLKILQDEEKLDKLRKEYGNIKDNINAKSLILKEKEDQLNALTIAIKNALENIFRAKKEILELVTKIANSHNEITDLNAKEQIYLARKKRLELEKAKVKEEESVIEDSLKEITRELENIQKTVENLNLKISATKNELDQESASLTNINAEIRDLEKQKLNLESHKEFIEKLRTKYEDIGETSHAVVYLDRMPTSEITGLVVKINAIEEASLKLSGEAKPFDLDTQKIDRKLNQIRQDLGALRKTKITKEGRIEELHKLIDELQEGLRAQEISLANQQTSQQGVLEQCHKIKEEEEVIVLELEDLAKEVARLAEKLSVLKASWDSLNKEQEQKEALIVNEQNNIAANSSRKEKFLVEITEIKTQLDGLIKRTDSDAATLKIWEDTCQQDKDNFSYLERQAKEGRAKIEALNLEIKDTQDKVSDSAGLTQKQRDALKLKEDEYKGISDGASDVFKKIELDRRELDKLKNKLHELQMQNKDMDFKFLSIKEKILQNYKIDLETMEDAGEGPDEDALLEEIAGLKEKLDACGTVNLVAIEEYDELKKRYDFLVTQQNDLISAKESLHEAIQKINRTTKKMFLETFARVREEFRNYFRMLFNGGDAQVFLIDEHDPLESGIEIICRPPGRKLQNVLLLSGGEKSLSAIALIFAIFKVKPSPFCILDEIDAALDEANVDRFSRMLQEFTKESQFIVITHNKRTIANADVMYGITMEESGVSKIVSVKFAQGHQPLNDKEPQAALSPAPA